MSVSPRLLVAVLALVGLSAAVVIHAAPHAVPQAGRTLFPPPGPAPSPAPLVLPSPAGAEGATWLPPVLRSPHGLWDLLNRDTAATTRGQIRLVQMLEETVRDQIRSLLQRPLGGV